MGLIIDGVSIRDLILDGQSVSLYEGGNPPVKVWPTGPRAVTIPVDYTTWMQDAMTGDVAMISGFPDQWTVTFEVPVVCDRNVNANGVVSAGTRIYPGVLVTVREKNITHTFTEAPRETV